MEVLDEEWPFSPSSTNILINATIIDRGAENAKAIMLKNPRMAAYVKVIPYAKELAKVAYSMVGRGQPFSQAIQDRGLSKTLDVFVDKQHEPEVRQAIKLVVKSIGELAFRESQTQVGGLKLEFHVDGQVQVHEIRASAEEFRELGESVLQDYPNATIIRFWTNDLYGTGRSWQFLEYQHGRWGNFQYPPNKSADGFR